MKPLWFAALTFASTTSLSAQLIQVRTTPVAQRDQFEIFPFQNMGMGGVSIAVHDTLADPFRNPATAGRMRAGRIFSSPGVYSVSSDAGRGRALPLGAFVRRGAWFAGAALAFQQVDPSQPQAQFFGGPVLATADVGQISIVTDPANGTGERTSHGNQFAVLMLGTQVGATAIGGSVSWSGIHARDGVDMLYPGAQQVDQSGNMLGLRLGALRELGPGRTLQAVVLHHRTRINHDVTFLDQFWDPQTQQFNQRQRLAYNRDYGTTWGMHVNYEHPLSEQGWKMGWLFTANRISSPSAPEYEFGGVPAGPGTAEAFNLGLGFSKKRGPSTFGLDLIYEPIFSRNHEITASAVTGPGGTIPAGGYTSDNRFSFSNVLLRMGLSRELELSSRTVGASAQLGLMVHKIAYRLRQDDILNATVTTSRQTWVEWTPTWGLSLRFPELELRYRGAVTNGAARPTQQFNNGFFGGGFGDPRFGPGPIVRQSAMGDVRVVAHQISLALPLR